MDLKIYFGLSLLYFISGIIAVSNSKYKNRALKFFIFLTILLPITKFTTAFHIIYQIDVYYFFFLGLVLVNVKKAAFKRKINKKLLVGILFTFLLLFFFILHYLLVVNESRSLINILKDIKPFIIFLLAFLFAQIYNSRLQLILNKQFINTVILLNFIISTLFVVLMFKYNLHLFFTNDPYFKYEGIRYETLGTYFCVFYLIYLFTNNIKISAKDLLLLIIPIFYTGNRTLIASVLLVLIIYFITRVRSDKVIIFFSTLILIGVGFIFFVKKASEQSPLARFKEIISYEYVSENLLNRFLPFINSIKSFKLMDFLIGKGMGYSFFIPWFTWRENIDNYNIYLDNLYLTLYVKYGLFFIAVFWLVYIYLKLFSTPKTFIYYFVFFLIVSLTNAMIYQYNFLWLLVLFAFPFKPSLNK